MSTSDLYILNGQSTTWVKKYQNGWGSAPVIWDHLIKKFMPEHANGYYLGNDIVMKQLWALASDDRLSYAERLVHMMTFDSAYIPLAHLKDAGEACQTFYEMSAPDRGERVNHWQEIGADLINLSQGDFHYRARGVCLSCTSVNDIWGSNNRKTISNAWPITGGSA